MWKYLGLFLAITLGVFFLLAVDSRADDRFMITNDGGGRMDEYVEALTHLSEQGQKLGVDGMCASACTLIFAKDFNFDVCITPKVKLGFHKPFRMSGGEIVFDIPSRTFSELAWSEYFYKRFPAWLQRKLTNVPSVYHNGGDPSEMKWLTYNDLKQNVRTCS